jgi:hypothetical protein
LSALSQKIAAIVRNMQIYGLRGWDFSPTEVDGTTYILSAVDDGALLYFTNASAIALTVPAGLGPDFECAIIQWGAGQVTISAGAAVTIHNRQSFTKTAGQYAMMSLVAPVADSFILAGDGA